MQHRRRTLVGSLLLAALLAVTPSFGQAEAQQACTLSPVFALLRDAVGADVVGTCTGDPTTTPSGDVTQATTRGILVLRGLDSVPAFTDGSTTWLSGPSGLQSRPNADRFPWETAAPPVVASPSAESQLPAAVTPSQVNAPCGPSIEQFRPIVRAIDPEQIGACRGTGLPPTERTRYQRGEHGIVWIEVGDLVQETEKGILTMVPGDTVQVFYGYDGYEWMWDPDNGLSRDWASDTAPEPSPPPPMPTPRPSNPVTEAAPIPPRSMPIAPPLPLATPTPTARPRATPTALPDLIAPPRTSPDGIETVSLLKVDGDTAFIERRSGDRYSLELGTGCLSAYRFEGKRVYVESPSLFAGVGSSLILPDNSGSCRIWSSRQIR